MTIYIKNMVCSRCKMLVKAEFEKHGLKVLSIQLGEVELGIDPGAEKMNRLALTLKDLGFEIIDNRKSRIIEQIKNLIVQLVHHADDYTNTNLSRLLSEKLHYEYNYLSNLFSEVEGITIEKYFIAQKIEKVKELLMYDELTLTQIADSLGYSSVAYLSNQFKKETGLSPSFYKSLKQNLRRNIEDI